MIHNLWNIVSTTYAGAAGMSLQIYTYKQFYFDELLEVHVFTLAELGWTDTRWNKIVVMVCTEKCDLIG
jgi:hypothetical protein